MDQELEQEQEQVQEQEDVTDLITTVRLDLHETP